MKQYIGYRLQPELSKSVEDAQAAVMRDSFRVPLEPHITVLSPPVLEEIDPEMVNRSLDRVIADHRSPLEVRLLGLGHFMGRVAILRVESEELTAIRNELCESLGINTHKSERVSGTTYNPHITIVQAKALHTPIDSDTWDTLKELEIPEYTTLTEIVHFQKEGGEAYSPAYTLEHS
jgi:2'-5' RNA ligase